MPDWGKLLSAYAEGANPEMFAKARAQKEEMTNNEQRRNLLASQESRAQAGEAREAEASEYGKSRRGVKEQADALALKAAGLSNDQIEVALQKGRFDVANQAEDRAHKMSKEDAASKRADRGMDYEGQRVGIAEGELGLRKDREKREAEFDAQANPLRIERMESEADPRQRYSADITAMSRMYEAAVRNGNQEEAAQWQSMIEKMAMRQEEESAAWSERRRKRTGGAAPPQGKPQPTAKDRASSSAGAWGKKKPSGDSY